MTTAHYTDPLGVWGGLTSQRTGPQSLLFAFELAGNTRLLTDAAGAVAAAYAYEAWGHILTQPSEVKYAGFVPSIEIAMRSVNSLASHEMLSTGSRSIVREKAAE